MGHLAGAGVDLGRLRVGSMTRVVGEHTVSWYPRLSDREHAAYVRDLQLGSAMCELLRALGIRR